MKKTILFLFLLGAPLLAEMKYASISLDSVNSYRIEKPSLLFGCFFEFMNEFINGAEGLWAQELYNRGFDLRKNDSFAEKWSALNSQSENAAKLIYGGYNENGVFYQNLSNTSESIIGIQQGIYFDTDKGGDFYVYLKNNATAPSKFVLSVMSQASKEVFFTDSIEITSKEWKKVSFHIPPFMSDNRISVALCLSGIGNIDLDEVSLMPSDNVNGVRKEFFDMFASWRPGVIRYPGGYFADTDLAHLEYMIGDMDKRKSPQTMGEDYQRLDFGINEFMDFCHSIGAEAHMTVNLVKGSAEEAANYVEYCNGDETTLYGKRRIADGVASPYGVRYWEIGNEQWDADWMLPRYVEWYDEMVKKDSSIQCIIDGDYWRGKGYFFRLMNHTLGKCHLYGWHPYIGLDQKHMKKKDSAQAFNMLMGWVHFIDEVAKEHHNYLFEGNFYPKAKQAITEHCFLWGDMFKNRDTTYRNCTLEAGLYQMGVLCSVLRNAQTMELYEKTFGFGHIRIGFDKSGKRIFYPTPFHTVTDFMSKNTGDVVYKINSESPMMNVALFNGGDYVTAPILDAMASSKGDTLYFYILNRNLDDSLSVSINHAFNFDSTTYKAFVLNSASILDYNTPDDPNKIQFRETKVESLNSIILEPHSGMLVKAVVKSIVDTVLVRNFYVSPNPVKDYMNISTKGHGNIQSITIYDTVGRKMLSNENSDNFEITLNLESFAPGAYFIEIKTETDRRLFKFIKS